MKSTAGKNRVGILEIACALAALVLVVGSLVWEMNLNPVIALVMLVAAYAVLRDMRALRLLKKRNEESHASESMVQSPGPSPQARFRQPSSALPEPGSE